MLIIPNHYVFRLCKIESNLALNVTDGKFISNTYQLHDENNQLCLYIYGGNYRAKEIMIYLLDNKLATVKRITKVDDYRDKTYKYYNHIHSPLVTDITFVFQLTPLMILNLC